MSEPFCETSVWRKEVCLEVGGSAPVAHWEGWSSWEGAAIVWWGGGGGKSDLLDL